MEYQFDTEREDLRYIYLSFLLDPYPERTTVDKTDESLHRKKDTTRTDTRSTRGKTFPLQQCYS